MYPLNFILPMCCKTYGTWDLSPVWVEDGVLQWAKDMGRQCVPCADMDIMCLCSMRTSRSLLKGALFFPNSS